MNALARWSVPMVAAFTIALYTFHLYHDEQRADIAESVGKALQNNPATREELETLLAPYIVKEIHGRNRIKAPSESALFELAPQLPLYLWVNYDADASHISRAAMMSSGFDFIPLESPREHLPQQFGWAFWVQGCLLAVSAAGLWLLATTPPLAKRRVIRNTVFVIAVLILSWSVGPALMALLQFKWLGLNPLASF